MLTALFIGQSTLAAAQPGATIALPAPGTTKQLYEGCNNITLTFPDGTNSETVVQAVDPSSAVESMWRHDAQAKKWKGYSPASAGASDLRTVNFLDAVWLCVAGAPSLPSPSPHPPSSPTPTGTAAPPSPTPSPTEAPTPEMTLREAIDGGVVEASITGVGHAGHGSSSGDAVMLGLTKKVPGEVHIDLPMGTALISSRSGVQHMVVFRVKGRASSQQSQTYVPTSAIVLTEDTQQWFQLEAYCLETELENPDYGTDFSVGAQAPPDVVQVLAAADRLEPKPSLEAIQLAVWAVSEDPTAIEVTSVFPASQQDFDEARAILEEAGIDPDSRRMFH